MGATKTGKQNVSDSNKDQPIGKEHGNMETGRTGMHTINLVTVCVFACGECEEVVLGQHLGQTAVVCDQSRGDATETSDLDNVDFLVKEACIVDV
jgi:hypothetical protein